MDIGAGHDGAVADLAAQPGYGDADERLVRLIRSDAIPSDPVAVNIPDDAQKAAVQESLFVVGQSADGKKALAIFWGNTQGLAKTDEKPYEYLQKVLADLGLTQDDLL